MIAEEKVGFIMLRSQFGLFLHFVSTDHLGTLINFGQKGDGSGSGTVSDEFL